MTTIKRQRKIIVPTKNIRLIMEEFGISKVCVYNALRFATNSELAKAVRQAAKERYDGCLTYIKVFED